MNRCLKEGGIERGPVKLGREQENRGIGAQMEAIGTNDLIKKKRYLEESVTNYGKKSKCEYFLKSMQSGIHSPSLFYKYIET